MSSSYFHYLYLFKTTLLDIDKSIPKIVVDPIKIEFLKEKRVYKIQQTDHYVYPQGALNVFPKEAEFTIDDDTTYISLITRTKENKAPTCVEVCENALNSTVSKLSQILSPDLFTDLVYKGWIYYDKKRLKQFWFKYSDEVLIDTENIINSLKGINYFHQRDKNLKKRFELMSKFYVKALSYQSLCEEKFIMLWTILEIYPMMNTTNIKPLCKKLAEILNQEDQQIVKNKLEIGRMFGLRSKLVHDGEFDLSYDDKIDLFKMLEDMVLEIMRNVSGLEYTNSLDEYFV